jgi:heavy metal translocating P-type ATPase
MRSQLESRVTSPARDMAFSFPAREFIRIDGSRIFSDLGSRPCKSFFERLFHAPEVCLAEIDQTRSFASVAFLPNNGDYLAIRHKIINLLTDRVKPANGRHIKDRIAVILGHYLACPEQPVRIFRYGKSISGWEIKHELEGRIRLKNPILYRKKDLCHAVEAELMNTLGVDRYDVNPLTCSVLVHFQPMKIKRHQLLSILDIALTKTEHPEICDQYDTDFPICTTTLALAAVARTALPALGPLSTLMFLYSSLPSYRGARDLLCKEKRLGVDVLDAVTLTGCLFAGEILAGTIMSWCLSLGRKLLKKTRDDSRKLLINAFGKQPRFVWVLRDGVEVELALEELTQEDHVVVETGEIVPVDGIIRDGFGMIDQHILTGESAPVEKGEGDRVYAATVMLAGKITVAVDKAGAKTAAAQIGKILNSTLDCKLDSQSRGEELADKAVAPTLALGALAAGTVGMGGAMAVVNCDLGTGIRIAAPLGMLTCLNLCARQGIMVKDGRALETMADVDTILFDKTGTLTRERPEVGRVLTWGEADENRIIQLAAAAEQKFSHPIARAIHEKFASLKLPLPEADQSTYRVGFGITVCIEGRTVRVGSARFMKMEGIALPEAVERGVNRIRRDGHSLIMVSVDDRLSGVIELRASQRPEVQEIITGLRARGMKHLAIISGDHDKPTRSLAERLGMDRYFAEVLPQEKARYVELLKQEGRKVCFVGDGINDAIALKTADVSISLRGAASLATDTAQVVFMEESLGKLCALVDTARLLQDNIKTSWRLILMPTALCVAGVFFLRFGLWHSVLFTNVPILMALANGMLPLRRATAAAEQGTGLFTVDRKLLA